jgi:hypothetical protein
VPDVGCVWGEVAVNVARYLGALVLLTTGVVASAQDMVEQDFHPTDAQVKEMQQSCAVSDTGMLALGEKVSAAVADWRKATAANSPAAAIKQLDEYFERVRKDGGVSGRKAIYVLCVEKSLRQFLDAQRDRPQPVDGAGSSSPLRRSTFKSEEDIWHSGCQQAESDAASRLQAQCGDRTLVVLSSECAQLTGSIRTYVAEINGECRGR